MSKHDTSALKPLRALLSAVKDKGNMEEWFRALEAREFRYTVASVPKDEFLEIYRSRAERADTSGRSIEGLRSALGRVTAEATPVVRVQGFVYEEGTIIVFTDDKGSKLLGACKCPKAEAVP